GAGAGIRSRTSPRASSRRSAHADGRAPASAVAGAAARERHAATSARSVHLRIDGSVSERYVVDMRLIKVAVASTRTTVGAVRSNVDRAVASARAMGAADGTLGGFHEQRVGGYPAEGMGQWHRSGAAQRRGLR